MPEVSFEHSNVEYVDIRTNMTLMVENLTVSFWRHQEQIVYEEGRRHLEQFSLEVKSLRDKAVYQHLA